MKRYVALTAALWLACAWFSSDVAAHGGSFRGPNGGVPPGLRTPHDPEPPPPPPSNPGPVPGSETPRDDPGGSVTPPDQGHDTSGGGLPAPTPPVPQPGTQPSGARTKPLTFESWRFWWAYNSDDILNLKSHIYSRDFSSSSPLRYASVQDRHNRRDAELPTRRMIQTVVLPALERSLHRPGDHEDIHGGAIVALGKIGSARHVAVFRDAMHGFFQARSGKTVDLGYQATESGALALGLLKDLDPQAKDAVRGVCLEAITDEKLRTRERAWAAVSLGLQRDRDAVRPLWDLLDRKYENDNIPAAILCAIGLVGDESLRENVEEVFYKGKLHGRDASDPVRAFAGYALAKIGDPKGLDVVLKVLKSRRFGRMIKRSAAIAAGVLASSPRAEEEQRKDAVRTLKQYLRRSGGDPAGENFAIIALSQVGTEPALRHLMEIAENGKYGQRPYAALGLGTHVWYRDRADDRMDEDLRALIVSKLAKLSFRFKDTDTRAAFLLARGLVKDSSAIHDLVGIAARKSADPLLRGYACVALGLIGDARAEVRDALTLALKERKSVDLRRDAATGLGLLRDAEALPLLLQELERAKSFAVQGQLITAIGTIGDHRAVEPLIGILDDTRQPEQTRAMAAVGLGMIGDLSEVPALARLSKNYNYRASVPDIDELLYIF